MLLGEVANPGTGALGPMIWIAGLLFAFGFVWVLRKLVEAIFNPIIAVVGFIPGLGGAIAGALHAVEQAISNALGTAENAIDKQLGVAFHLLARYMDWLWREIRGHAVLIAELAAGIAPIYELIHFLKGKVDHVASTRTADAARIKRLEKEYHGIDVQLRHLEKEFHGIDETGLRKQIHSLDKEIGRIETQTIPAIKQADTDAASAISNLYEWVKGKAAILGVGTFSTAVAAAIGIEVFNWLRCNSASNLAKKYKCGFWKWIEDALALIATLALGAFSVLKPQVLAEAAVAAVDEIEPILAEILKN